jgi:hypothetical protein
LYVLVLLWCLNLLNIATVDSEDAGKIKTALVVAGHADAGVKVKCLERTAEVTIDKLSAPAEAKSTTPPILNPKVAPKVEAAGESAVVSSIPTVTAASKPSDAEINDCSKDNVLVNGICKRLVPNHTRDEL